MYTWESIYPEPGGKIESDKRVYLTWGLFWDEEPRLKNAETRETIQNVILLS